MNLKNTGKYGVVIQYDNEDLAKMLVVAEHEAIELRDLLLREFPVDEDAEDIAAAEAAMSEQGLSIPWEPLASRRERIATAAMNAMRQTRFGRDLPPDHVAADALADADALIAALDKGQP